MSTLRTTTISNIAGTVSIPVTTVVNGTAKAWIAFSAVTGTIFASFNVSSLTYLGSAQWEITLTTGISTAYGSVVVGGDRHDLIKNGHMVNSTTARVAAYQPGGSGYTGADPTYFSVAVFG